MVEAMPAILLNSHDLVHETDNQTVARARALRQEDVVPHLGVVLIGEATPFVRLKQRRGHELGVEVSTYRLPDSVSVAEASAVISFLAVDPAVHGILLQLPLTASWQNHDIDALIDAIPADKDVDGLKNGRPDKLSADNIEAAAQEAHAAGTFLPTTAWSMLSLCHCYHLPLDETVVVGKGRLVGQPLHLLLKMMDQPHKWVDLQSVDREAAISRAGLILAGTDSVKPIFTDANVKAGVAICAAGQEIDHEALRDYAAFLSPERGGVGPLTVSYLMQQTVIAAERQHAARIHS